MSEARPRCPVCGKEPVEWRRQVETHDDPMAPTLRMEPGEQRYICAEGHHFDEKGQDRGTTMPPDITIKHDPFYE